MAHCPDLRSPQRTPRSLCTRQTILGLQAWLLKAIHSEFHHTFTYDFHSEFHNFTYDFQRACSERSAKKREGNWAVGHTDGQTWSTAAVKTPWEQPPASAAQSWTDPSGCGVSLQQTPAQPAPAAAALSRSPLLSPSPRHHRGPRAPEEVADTSHPRGARGERVGEIS